MKYSKTINGNNRPPKKGLCCCCKSSAVHVIEDRPTGSNGTIEHWPYCQSCWKELEQMRKDFIPARSSMRSALWRSPAPRHSSASKFLLHWYKDPFPNAGRN